MSETKPPNNQPAIPTTTLMVALAVIVVVVMIGAVAIVIWGPVEDKTSLVLVLAFMGPVVLGILTLLQTSKAVARTEALEIKVDGRLSDLLRKTEESATAQATVAAQQTAVEVASKAAADAADAAKESSERAAVIAKEVAREVAKALALRDVPVTTGVISTATAEIPGATATVIIEATEQTEQEEANNGN